jgi:PIN domain nuclease of toxin-antitoxin system
VQVLLDTQAVILLYVEGSGAVSAKTRRILEDPETIRLISAVSVTEIAIKTRLGKLKFGRGQIVAEEMSRITADLRADLIPYSARHANALVDLPLHHGDPFDRMLIATALTEVVPIVSADREFRRYKGLQVLW